MKLASEEVLRTRSLSQDILTEFPDQITLIDPNLAEPADLSPDQHIGVVDGLNSLDLLTTLLHTGLRHIVQESSLSFEEEIRASAILLSQPQRFLTEPLQTLLGTKIQNNPAFHRSFRGLEDKEPFMLELSNYLNRIPGSHPIVNTAQTIADELFLNAVLRAPQLSPSTQSVPIRHIHIAGAEAAEFSVGFSEKSLVMCCTDPFGTLNPDEVLKRLTRIYHQGVTQSIRMEGDGAGIGLRHVFENSNSFTLAVLKGVKTVIAVSLALGKGLKTSSVICKNIHIALLNEDQKGGLMPSLRVTELRKDHSLILKLDGPINEEAVLKIPTLTGVKGLIIDLSKVTMINSCGIRDWIKWIRTFPNQLRIYYVNCPRWFVEQMNIVVGFLPSNVEVSSFSVPYYCEKCETVTDLLLTRTEDYPNGKPEPQTSIKCSSCKGTAEIDVIEASYFKFLENE